MRRAALGLIALALAAAFPGLDAAAGPAPDGASVVTPGPFALTRADGRKLDSLELDGAPYGLMFGFTHCPDVCPTALADVTVALSKAPALRPDFHIYFVAVDDARDTPDAVRAYLEPFDRRILGLTGSRLEIAEAAQAFGATARRREFADGGYTMEHTAALFLVDGNGVIVDRVAFSEAPETMGARIAAAAAR